VDRLPPGVFPKFFIEPCICRTDIMSDVHVSRAPFPVTAESLVNRQLSFARSAKRRLFKPLRGRFWCFSPRRVDTLHRWGGVKFGVEEATEGPLLQAKFHPHWCNSNGIGPPPKLKFLLRFDQNAEY